MDSRVDLARAGAFGNVLEQLIEAVKLYRESPSSEIGLAVRELSERLVSLSGEARTLGATPALRELANRLATPFEEARTRAEPPARMLFDYWGPRGLATDYPVAPGADYYRLVNDDDEAEEAIAVGERPLHGHRGMSPQDLNRQQFLQWEGPKRLFGVDPTGRPTSESGGPGARARVPVWPFERFPWGQGEFELPRVLENLKRTAPEMLDRPADLPPKIGDQSRATPGVDLAAAFRPRAVDLTVPRQVAVDSRRPPRDPGVQGESVIENYYEMRERAPGPTTPHTPGIFPEDLGAPRASVARVGRLVPLAEAWPRLLGGG